MENQDEETALLGNAPVNKDAQPIRRNGAMDDDIQRHHGGMDDDIQREHHEDRNSDENESNSMDRNPSRSTMCQTEQRGCMLCRQEITVTEIEMLEPGDHIAYGVQNDFFQYCCKHHEIVTENEHVIQQTDIQQTDAHIKVVGVHKKKKEKSDDSSYVIKEEKQQISATDEIGKKSRKITKMVYKKRRNSLKTTAQIARRLAGNYEERKNEGDKDYDLLKHNCEHFAIACVNGDKDIKIEDIPKKSSSLQAQLCWWRIFHLSFWIVQALCYFLNFNIYVTFVAGDRNLSFMNQSAFLRHCYNPKNQVPGFDTFCDWIVVACFVLILASIYIGVAYCYHQRLYNDKVICAKCLGISRVDFVSKLFAFVFIEIVSILLERPLSKVAVGMAIGWAYSFMIFISMISAWIVYSLSSVFTRLFGMCCFPTCTRACELHKYVQFRGIVWICCWLFRKIKTKILEPKNKIRILKKVVKDV